MQSHAKHIDEHSPCGAGIEGSIKRAIGVQAGDAVVGRTVNTGETAADDDFPVRLQSDGTHPAGRPRAGIEGRVERAVRVQTSNGVSWAEHGGVATDDDLPVRLHSDGVHDEPRHRIEGSVKGAVRIQAGDLIARRAVDRVEDAADDDLPVRLQRDGKHLEVRS